MNIVHIGIEYFKTHPNFSVDNENWPGVFDIGLIKTASEAKPDQRDPGSTFLCLPTKDFPFSNGRMAMVAGWSEAPKEKDLQIGPIFLETEWSFYLPKLKANIFFNNARTCKVIQTLELSWLIFILIFLLLYVCLRTIPDPPIGCITWEGLL